MGFISTGRGSSCKSVEAMELGGQSQFSQAINNTVIIIMQGKSDVAHGSSK